MAPSHWTLSDIEWSKYIYIYIKLTFRSLIDRKRAKLGHMLLSNINKKSYMGSPTAQSYWTLQDIKTSKSRPLKVWRPISGNVAVGHMLLLNINMKSYVGNRRWHRHI